MRKVFMLFTAVCLLLIDQTILPFFSVYGAFGSILFTFWGLLALRTDVDDAVLMAVIAGVLQDIFFPYGFGLNTLINLFLYLGLSRIGQSLKEERRFIKILLITLAGGIKAFVMFIILMILGIRGSYPAVIVIPAYTFILGLLLYRIVVSYSRIPLIKKEWRFY